MDQVKQATSEYASYDPGTETGKLASERKEAAKKIHEAAKQRAAEKREAEQKDVSQKETTASASKPAAKEPVAKKPLPRHQRIKKPRLQRRPRPENLQAQRAHQRESQQMMQPLRIKDEQ